MSETEHISELAPTTTPPTLPNASDPRLLVNLRTGRTTLPEAGNRRLLARTPKGLTLTADDWSNLALGFLIGCTAWVVALPWLPR